MISRCMDRVVRNRDDNEMRCCCVVTIEHAHTNDICGRTNMDFEQTILD